MYNAKLKDAHLYKDNDLYFIDATYEINDDDGLKALHIPKIRIPIEYLRNIYSECVDYGNTRDNRVTIQFSNIELDVFPIKKDGSTVCMESRNIVRNMTISQIEKELGYKINIKED